MSIRCAASCAAPPAVDPTTGQGSDRVAYVSLAQDAAIDLLAAWLQMLLDCLCHAFLPQCEDDPCDERVEIACVTVKAGKIVDICNHSCRHYAGSFPSTFYWMSLIPLIPLVARMLAMVCCQPALLRRNSPLVNDFAALLGTVDPTGRLAEKVIADDFAAPRRYLAVLSKLADTPILATLVARIERAVSPKATVEPAAPAAAPPVAAATRADLASEAAALRQEIADLRLSVAALQAPAGARTTKTTGKGI